ncbi:ligase-associated DNA damage response DEXH box helicase [Rapidithrix thailandica]|uniref:Ligase-associated DNA damage response DEXH box helicase n=1 Tax=Rapidithrix thailandica TaxID=413964 RepID=A0AAW9SKB1_9BACT
MTEQLIHTSQGYQQIHQWFLKNHWQPFPFQQKTWISYLQGNSGLLNAPTGSGKTYALWMPCLAEYINSVHTSTKSTHKGLQVLWITPLRALTKDIHRAMEEACRALDVPWRIAFRTGDTSTKERQAQKKDMPECLITTPESLHILLATKGYERFFKNLKAFIVDEWHELLGSKRGVQVELALSKIIGLNPNVKVWGISATIGNLPQAADVLLSPVQKAPHNIIRAHLQKKIKVASILPDRIEKFPWAGHLGIHLANKILPVIQQSKTTLLFTNTRAQTEIWYQKLLEISPDLAGCMAMHHGSLDNEIRTWVEEALHKGILKLVVCTSSLDLGVDFRPVETVIQVGSPKGVARFLQRAGRSGHQPGALSNIYFLPTHSLELIEGAALKQAAYELSHHNHSSSIEHRYPIVKPLDVLVQYLVTLAVSEGFIATQVYQELRNTHAYRSLSNEEWQWILNFITSGGSSLGAYDEFHKVVREGSVYKVTSRKVAMRHRISIGTIVSEPLIKVKYKSGGYIGSVEEYFISSLKAGDVFWFAGRNLEFIRLKEMTAQVQATRKKSGKIPRWMGGRLSLSSQLSQLLRQNLEKAMHSQEPELLAIRPLLELQSRWSVLPKQDEFLIEQVRTSEGYHVFFYPFEGRMVHEVMAALIAYRISQITPITLSIAMNDYGFELLADQEIPLEHALEMDLFTQENLIFDIEQSMNNSEMAKRKFRDIASIAGLIFQGYPGQKKRSRHLQASSQLLFEVFFEYDPENLLVQQAYDEVIRIQLEHNRLVDVLDKIKKQKLLLQKPPKPTPFAFPILVDRLRDQISSESLDTRIQKIQQQLEAFAGEEK